MFRFATVTLLVIVCLANLAEFKKLPSFFKLCKRSDPDHLQCVKDSIESLRPRLKEGIPVIKALPLNPLHIPLIKVETEKFNFNMSNVQIDKLYDFTVEDVQADMDKLEMKFKFNYPEFTFMSDYDVLGQALILHLDGHGNVSSVVKNTDIYVDLCFEKFVKEDKTFLKVKDLKIHIDPHEITTRMENLFENPKWTESANRIINLEALEFYKLSSPTMDRTCEEILRPMFNYIFSTWTFDQLFPQ